MFIALPHVFRIREILKFDTQYDNISIFDTQFVTSSKFDVQSMNFLKKDSPHILTSIAYDIVLSCEQTELPLAIYSSL
jgi:hypothetical protein